MRTGFFPVNKYICNLRHSIKMQFNLFTFYRFGQFYPLTIPSCFYFSIFESIIFTTFGLLLKIGI